MIVCLSDENDYKGGIFKLVDLNKRFKFSKGDLLLFKSDLLHGVEPVTDGI
jgi:predicted 2-oxoglutarate/Fe(II)-dependent dioxygenase YbiX